MPTAELKIIVPIMNTIYKDKVANGLFWNAIASIQLGVEDYAQAKKEQPENNKRLVSATRNLFSGILLLFKSLLAEESSSSDYSLLKAKLSAKYIDGKIVWLGTGMKTVNYEKLKENLHSINVGIDFKKLSKLHDYRNSIEHYYDIDKLQFNAVEGFLSDAFEVVSEFLVNELDLQREIIEELITPDILNILVESSAVITKAREKQDAEFSHLLWHNGAREAITDTCCPKCGTSVLIPKAARHGTSADEVRFKCRGCGEDFSYVEIVKNYAEKRNDEETGVKPGDIIPPPIFFRCEECGETTFSFPDKRCINCGHEDSLRCRFCDNDIDEWEYEVYIDTSHLCSHCDHILSKND